MRAIVKVYDKRTSQGINTRGKNFTNIKDAIEWARNLKNKASDWITIIDSGVAYELRCG